VGAAVAVVGAAVAVVGAAVVHVSITGNASLVFAAWKFARRRQLRLKAARY